MDETKIPRPPQRAIQQPTNLPKEKTTLRQPTPTLPTAPINHKNLNRPSKTSLFKENVGQNELRRRRKNESLKHFRPLFWKNLKERASFGGEFKLKIRFRGSKKLVGEVNIG